MTERERLIEIIIKSVDGCAESWAGLIADGLLRSGIIVVLPFEKLTLQEVLKKYNPELLKGGADE